MEDQIFHFLFMGLCKDEEKPLLLIRKKFYINAQFLGYNKIRALFCMSDTNPQYLEYSF